MTLENLTALFPDGPSDSQKEGIVTILKSCDRWKVILKNQRAYVLATAYHESWHTMRGIDEVGHGKGRVYGNPDPITHQIYYGRGLCGLTWKNNYITFSKLLCEDFLNHPELVNEEPWSSEILVTGMQKGLFTGKKLSDYFSNFTTDYVEARRIINRLDKANEIASYAHEFYKNI